MYNMKKVTFTRYLVNELKLGAFYYKQILHVIGLLFLLNISNL